MTVFDRMEEAVGNRDAEAYLALYTDDAVFVRHQSGTSMTKSQFGEMIQRMMGSDNMDMGTCNRECRGLPLSERKLPR